MHGCWTIAIAVPLAALRVGSAQASGPKVAVFNFERVDTNLEGATCGPRPNQQQRLALAGSDLFAHGGAFR
jgi:hypothetical protein